MRTFPCLRLVLALVLMAMQPFMGQATPPILNTQKKESYALLDLEGRGISAYEAASLTDRLRSELVIIGRITVVERGQMEQVLAEQDFQLAGCTSDECAVEVGQLLGITKMFAGSIGKVGMTYSIDIRIIDVGTGRITNSIIHDYRGEIDGLLIEMKSLAQWIVDLEASQAITQEKPQPVMATMDIDSQPTGAYVLLDDEGVGTTPLNELEIKPERLHTVSFSLDGYQPIDTTLFAEAGQHIELTIPLESLKSWLTVMSTPPGALVMLDTRELGRTPLTQFEVGSEVQHTVSITIAEYQRVDTTFFIEPGRHNRLFISLRPVESPLAAAGAPKPLPSDIKQPQPFDTSLRVPDPRTALLLGLIPGGGQLYNGKWLKALIVMAVEGYYIYLFQQNRDFYNHYDESLPLSRDRYLEERNKYAWRFVFVYILGLMDGYVDAHLSTFPPDTSYQAQPLPPSNQSIEESP